MAKNVKVNIDLSKPAGSVGIGYPLIVCIIGGGTEISYGECGSLDEVKAYISSQGGGDPSVLEDNAGLIEAAEMIFSQENRPEKVAIASTSAPSDAEYFITNEITPNINKGWRQLIVVDNANAGYTISIADYIETTDKMYFVAMSKSAFEALDLEGKDYKRTVFFVHRTNKRTYAEAALVGETAGRPAGSFTYMFKTLKGVTPDVYTDAELEAIHAAGGIAYITNAGDDVTSEGISQNGTYIDETDSIDYVVQNIKYRVQKVLNGSAKVPYDDTGIAMLEAAATSALQEAAVNGIIAQKEDGSYDYSVSFGARSTTSEGDRANRIYKRGAFSFVLAGAIHNVEVSGEITY